MGLVRGGRAAGDRVAVGTEASQQVPAPPRRTICSAGWSPCLPPLRATRRRCDTSECRSLEPLFRNTIQVLSIYIRRCGKIAVVRYTRKFNWLPTLRSAGASRGAIMDVSECVRIAATEGRLSAVYCPSTLDAVRSWKETYIYYFSLIS